MGIYARYVLPRLIDVSMKNPETARLRAAWIPRALGDVLEVGIGSGLNLSFYSPQVRRVYGVDPSAPLRDMARTRAQELPLRVDFLLQSAEEPLPLEAASIDTAVVTWTLCSIADPFRALQQVRRVLKPGGLVIFIEHGRAPDADVVAWQDRMTPIWKRIGGNCHLNRKIDDLVSSEGFRVAELRTEYLPGPRPMTYTYQGVAERSRVGDDAAVRPGTALKTHAGG